MFKKSKNRFVEIDLLRGLAVWGMIVYHFFYIGNFYGFFEINFKTLPWLIAARTVQFIFLGLVGVSLSLSRSSGAKFYSKQFKRFFVVALLAMLVTLFTYIFVPDRMIVWGVLHLIAFSILTLQFVAKKPIAALFIGLFAAIFGFVIGSMGTDQSLFLNILGFDVRGFYSLDYFPIFPWISVVAFGIVFGNLIYKKGSSIIKSENISENFLSRVVSFCGRNALVIYIAHFIILLAFWNLF